MVIKIMCIYPVSYTHLDVPGQQNLFDEAEVEQDASLLEEETVIREHIRDRKSVV